MSMFTREYSQQIADCIRNFLTEDDWHFTFDENIGVFRFTLNLKSRIKKVDYHIFVSDDEYLVYGVCPIGAESDDSEMIAEMARFVCRANYGLHNGCFELDANDGEIRYKSYVDCEEQLPSREIIRNSIYVVASMYNRYSSGLLAVVFAGASAEEAIAMCEE